MRPRSWAVVVGLVALALGALAPSSLAQIEPEVGQVRVLDQGAEPRRLLRYAWPEGLTATSRIQLVVDTSTSIDGVVMMQQHIPTSMSLTSRIADIDAHGVARIEWRIEEVDFSAMSTTIEGAPVSDEDMSRVADEMSAAADALVGAGGRTLVDAQGTVLEHALQASPLIPGDLLVQVEQLVTLSEPLPDEPVGPGAVWEATTTSAAGGIETAITTIYEVVELTPDSVVLAERLKAAPQRGRGAASMAGRAQLLDFEAAGTGETTIALDRLARRSHSTVTLRLLLRVEDDGERVRVASEHVIDMTILTE